VLLNLADVVGAGSQVGAGQNCWPVPRGTRVPAAVHRESVEAARVRPVLGIADVRLALERVKRRADSDLTVRSNDLTPQRFGGHIASRSDVCAPWSYPGWPPAGAMASYRFRKADAGTVGGDDR